MENKMLEEFSPEGRAIILQWGVYNPDWKKVAAYFKRKPKWLPKDPEKRAHRLAEHAAIARDVERIIENPALYDALVTEARARQEAVARRRIYATTSVGASQDTEEASASPGL